MRTHVTTFFLAWRENTAPDRGTIENHLKDCTDCREYFEKMTLLLEHTDTHHNPRLQPDPYLPSRIAALVNERKNIGPKKLVHAARWSFASLAFALAIVIGILLGKGLSPASPQYKTSEIISTYYNAVSQQNFSTELESVVESTQKDQQ